MLVEAGFKINYEISFQSCYGRAMETAGERRLILLVLIAVLLGPTALDRSLDLTADPPQGMVRPQPDPSSRPCEQPTTNPSTERQVQLILILALFLENSRRQPGRQAEL